MKRLIIISISAVLLSYCSNHPELGEGYRINNDGKYTLAIVNSQNNIMVGETVLEYAFDSTFIIACQRPWDSIHGIRTMNYAQSNEAFENSTFRQYWIIKKKEKNMYSYDSILGLAKYSNVYGPFKKKEYLLKRMEFDVPKKLQLQEENK